MCVRFILLVTEHTPPMAQTEALSKMRIAPQCQASYRDLPHQGAYLPRYPRSMHGFKQSSPSIRWDRLITQLYFAGLNLRCSSLGNCRRRIAAHKSLTGDVMVTPEVPRRSGNRVNWRCTSPYTWVEEWLSAPMVQLQCWEVGLASLSVITPYPATVGNVCKVMRSPVEQ